MISLENLVDKIIEAVLKYTDPQLDMDGHLPLVLSYTNEQLTNYLTNRIDDATKKNPERKSTLKYYAGTAIELKTLVKSNSILDEQAKNDLTVKVEHLLLTTKALLNIAQLASVFLPDGTKVSQCSTMSRNLSTLGTSLQGSLQAYLTFKNNAREDAAFLVDTQQNPLLIAKLTTDSRSATQKQNELEQQLALQNIELEQLKQERSKNLEKITELENNITSEAQTKITLQSTLESIKDQLDKVKLELDGKNRELKTSSALLLKGQMNYQQLGVQSNTQLDKIKELEAELATLKTPTAPKTIPSVETALATLPVTSTANKPTPKQHTAPTPKASKANSKCTILSPTGTVQPASMFGGTGVSLNLDGVLGKEPGQLPSSSH